MKQDSLGGLDTQSFKQLRMSQRELNHLPDLLDHRSQTAYVLVADLGIARIGSLTCSPTRTSVPSVTITASALGLVLVTTRLTVRPMILIGTKSPRDRTRPSSSWLRYSSPPTIRRGSVGASVRRSAIFASIFRIVTLSSIETPALFLR